MGKAFDNAKLLLTSITSLTILSSCAASSVLGVGGTDFVVDLSQGKPENRERGPYVYS